MRRLLALSLAATAVLAGCAVAPTPRPDIPSASIGGLIRYPSEATPMMRICALSMSGQGTCTSTVPGQRDYRIAGLASGEYQVVAALAEGDIRVGGHVVQVQCIRAPCPEQLKSVVVPAAVAVNGIDLNGFYPSREDFPRLP